MNLYNWGPIRMNELMRLCTKLKEVINCPNPIHCSRCTLSSELDHVGDSFNGGGKLQME
jgi:hypothetical protein